jgi:hypothetical protein
VQADPPDRKGRRTVGGQDKEADEEDRIAPDVRQVRGGYFQSEAILKLKLAATISTLEQIRWAHPSASIAQALHQLKVMFQVRFEDEEP